MAANKLRKVGNPIPNQYIIVFNDDLPSEQIDTLAFNLANTHHGLLQATYHHAIKGFSIHNIPEAVAIAISNDPRVEFIEENVTGKTAGFQSIPTPSNSVASP